MFFIMNSVEISLPVNFDNVRVEIIFDKIKSMVNKMMSILSEEILSAK